MFGYDVFLASKGIIRHPVLSGLMAIAIALGIAFFMAILTIGTSLKTNPLPHKNDVLFRVQLDAGDPNRQSNDPRSRPHQLTYIDAIALMREAAAARQSAMFSTIAIIRPEQTEIPFEVTGRAVYGDFFAMFDAPFKHGGPWDDNAEENRERVVVLAESLSERMFGDDNPTGQHITLKEELFRVVGVLEDWDLVPRVYDFQWESPEQSFVPFTTAAEMEFRRTGSTNCWQPIPNGGLQGFLASECTWIQFWIELDEPSERSDYLNFLDAYATQQKSLGRFQRPLNNAIQTIDEWAVYIRVVDEGIWITGLIALLFLVVCIVNTIGLLLAKFLSRTRELAIHRALGATRGELIGRFLVEAGCIGFAGGIVGLLFAWLGLLGIRVLLRGDDAVHHITQLDIPLALLTVLLGIVVSLAASIYPAWRSSRTTPANLLRGV